MPSFDSLLASSPLVTTISDVELVQVGTWWASTGVTTITADHLRSMVEAASDPLVDRAPIKPGHGKSRFSGEPAVGFVGNLRIEPRHPRGPDGRPDTTKDRVDTLVGDLEGVPAPLAAVIPAAWPSRSAEIAWGVPTTAGRRYTAALSGLALLGIEPPAVKTLNDVAAIYGVEPAGSTPADVAERAVTTLSAMPATPADQAASEAAWAGMRTTPPGLGNSGASTPAPDQGGRMDEARLRELLGVEANADIEAAIRQLRQAAPAAAPQPTAAGTPAPPEPGPTPPPDPGVPQPPTQPPTGSPAQPAPAQAVAPAPGAASAPAPGAAAPPAGTPGAALPTPPGGTWQQLPNGMVAIAPEVLNALQNGAVQGQEAYRQLESQRLEQELVTAFAGKWTPAERANLLTLLQVAPEHTRSMLAARPAVLATSALGSDTADRGAQGQAADAAWDSADQRFFGIAPPAQPAQGQAR